ncbi:MAG: hypothetical protein RLZZ387_3367 [Chloroflexota bacterium]
MDTHKSDWGDCSSPPALDELELVAAADGEAAPHVRVHLASCAFCAARARDLAALQGALRTRLFRVLCPPGDELAAYQHRMLPEIRGSAVEAHVAECPYCARELSLIAYSSHDSPEDRRVPLRRITALPLAPPPGLAPARLYGAVRSAHGAVQFDYRAENFELTLRVSRDVGHPDLLVMAGTLASEDDLIADGLGSSTASLMCREALLAVSRLDELGEFIFDDVQPGEYSLSLRLGECEVVVETLAL